MGQAAADRHGPRHQLRQYKTFTWASTHPQGGINSVRYQRIIADISSRLGAKGTAIIRRGPHLGADARQAAEGRYRTWNHYGDNYTTTKARFRSTRSTPRPSAPCGTGRSPTRSTPKARSGTASGRAGQAAGTLPGSLSSGSRRRLSVLVRTGPLRPTSEHEGKWLPG